MEWSLMGWVPALLLGCVLGGVGGVLGIGGGIIAIPVLALVFGMDQQMAQGTALVMMMPNVLIGFWRYRQRNPFSLRAVALMGLASIVATYPAARIAVTMDAQVLKVCFAFFLLGLPAYFFYNSRAHVPMLETATPWLG